MILQDYLAAAKRRRDIKNNTETVPCNQLSQCLEPATLKWYCSSYKYQEVCIPERTDGAYLSKIVEKNAIYANCLETSSQFCRAFSSAFDESFG